DRVRLRARRGLRTRRREGRAPRVLEGEPGHRAASLHRHRQGRQRHGPRQGARPRLCRRQLRRLRCRRDLGLLQAQIPGRGAGRRAAVRGSAALDAAAGTAAGGRLMGRTYGKIEIAFWTNPKIRKLDIQARELLLHLFSCPHGNLAGCFVLPLEYVTADLRLDEAKASVYLKHLADEGYIERDEVTGATRIRGWWGHNGIENENVGRAVVRTLLSLPDTIIRLHAFADLARQLGTNKFSPRVQEAIRNLLPAHRKPRGKKKQPPANGQFSFANASESVTKRSDTPKPKPKPIDQTSHQEPRARGACERRRAQAFAVAWLTAWARRAATGPSPEDPGVRLRSLRRARHGCARQLPGRRR